MKQNETTKLWHFESYDELRRFVALNLPVYVKNPTGMGWEHLIDRVENYPLEQFTLPFHYVSYDIDARTMLEGLYEAGDVLARVTTTKGGGGTFTAKELATDNALNYPQAEHTVFCITTPNGCAKVEQGALYGAIYWMEKAEGVTATKRRRFAIKSEAEDGDVVLRLTFLADKELAKMKACCYKDGLRPIMCQPAIELKTGIAVASDGHILVAHKLKGYKCEQIGEIAEELRDFANISIPKEVCQMKGAITVEVRNDRAAFSCDKDETDCLRITATDLSGRTAEVRQWGKYANWRSVFPSEFGPAIQLDCKAIVKAVKMQKPNMNERSHLMKLLAHDGAAALTVQADDIDWGRHGKTDVTLTGGVPGGICVGVKADALTTMMGFDFDVLHFTSCDRSMVYVAKDTLGLQMPMLIDDGEGYPTATQGTKQMFSVSDWAAPDDAAVQPAPAAKPTTKAQAPKARRTKAAAAKTATHKPASAPRPAVLPSAPAHKPATPSLSLAERLRLRLRAALAA